MKKNILSLLLSISLVISPLPCISVSAATAETSAQSGTDTAAAESSADPLPARENDPGYERLSGQYKPAAEENIAAAQTGNTASPAKATETPAAKSSKTTDSIANILSAAPASRLRGDRSTTSNYTGQTYNHSSALDGMNIYNGIDVSYHQGTIDWTSVKEAGIDFAILRLGYRGYSNGSLQTDTKFTTYIQDASAAGIPLGVYFWTEAVSVTEAVQEAQYVINQLAAWKSQITMPVAIDWELNSNSRHAGLTKETNTAICTAFCDLIAQNGYTPMIYANVSDLNNNLDGAALSQKYEIWVARYNNAVNNSTAQFSGNYCIWQYSSDGSVGGISGKVDMNFWYTTGSPSSPSFTHGSTQGAIATPSPSPDTSNDIDELEDVENLTVSCAAKKLTLSWDSVDEADGYQVYRKDSYNGSYKKQKEITDADVTSWTNTGLSKNHEYYYKVRAFHKNSDGTVIYSAYTKITAATKAAGQVGLARKNIVLYRKPVKKSSTLLTVKKGMALEYAGRTFRSNGKIFYHFRYHTASKVYDGYRTSKSGLTYYTQGTTTAKLNLRKTAGTSGKLLASIPKNTPLPLLGTRKVKKTTWYRVCFSTRKNTTVTGYVSGNYLKTP